MLCLTLNSDYINDNHVEFLKYKDLVDLIELKTSCMYLITDYLKEFPSILSLSEEKVFNLYEFKKFNVKYIDIPYDRRYELNDIKSTFNDNKIKYICSYHNYKYTPEYEELNTIYDSIIKDGFIPKIATKIRNFSDLITLYKLSLRAEDKIMIGMGNKGLPSRILYKKFNSILTYTSSNNEKIGQINPEIMNKIYHANEIDKKSKIYGVLGSDVRNSASHLVHNKNKDYIFVPFSTESIESFKYTEEVKTLKACNTVKILNSGKRIGYNTDYLAAKEIFSGKHYKTAVIIGAGGVSKAVFGAIQPICDKIYIINRTKKRTIPFLKYGNCFETEEIPKETELIINATPINPLTNYKLKKRQTLLELPYIIGKETELESYAKKTCNTVITGLEFLKIQAKYQDEIFNL